MEEVLPKINWKDYFYYDKTSPTFLRWAVTILAGRTGRTAVVTKGDEAGCLIKNKDGRPKCIDVRYNNKLYKVHRIIYELEVGQIQHGYVIDHLDQNPWNNKIENLCPKPKAMNHRNIRLPASNNSGKIGVGWRTMNKGKHTYAVGRVQCDGVCYSATFGVHHYGLLPAFKKACEWRSKKVQELNATKNADFTPLHGLSEVAENRVV